jgi:glycopeptide antibiotics resistance protein
MRRPIALALAGVYAINLMFVAMWPTHIDQNLDMAHRWPITWLVGLFDLTPATGYEIGEFSANILLFVPLGILAMMLLPRLSWQRTVVSAGALSTLIELVQTFLRPERTGDPRDVIANALGAAVGAALFLTVRAQTVRR